MEIIYPPLVEQSYQYFQSIQSPLTKAEVYRLLVEQEVIDAFGNPTNHSLQLGWVREYTEVENASFEEFLMIYPLFRQYDASCFYLLEGFWEMTQALKKELIEQLHRDMFNYEEQCQLEAYFENRQEIYG